MKRSIGKTLGLVVLLGAVVFLLFAVAPYRLPTSVALGPCGRDWTSPSSYVPRSSPTRSEEFQGEGVAVKVCWGSPSVRGRDIFGGLVPWGALWRMGANEPTRLFLDGAVEIGGIALAPGRYSLYAVPGPEAWEIFISTSTFHWGNAITPDVRAREVGSFVVEPERLGGMVEELRFQWRPGDGGQGDLEMEWADTRVPMAMKLGGVR